MITVGFGRLSPVLAHIEHSSLDSNPVHVAGQLFRNISLAPCGQTNHCDHMGNVDISGGTITCGANRKELQSKSNIHTLAH